MPSPPNIPRGCFILHVEIHFIDNLKTQKSGENSPKPQRDVTKWNHVEYKLAKERNYLVYVLSFQCIDDVILANGRSRRC
jgi:hypothetical protein